MIRIATSILIFSCAVCIAMPGIGLSAETAVVKLVSPGEKHYWVGQQIGFAIELLVLGEFSGTPQFDIPKVRGVIVMKVGQRPTLSTQKINGESYVVQRHDFALFAQRPGICKLPSFTVRFDSKERFDKPLTHNRLSTEPLKVAVELPEGAMPGTSIISTTELTADEQWKPRLDQAKVGDALIRTITMKASDVPGMLLPELTHHSVDGLKMYRKEPRIRDSTERGGLVGERIESTTYVCSKPGDYEIPELVIRWWDVDQEAWKESRLPGIALKVTPNPALADESRSRTTSELARSDPGSNPILLVFVGVLLVGLLMALPRLIMTVSARRKRWLDSEAGLFALLVKACREGNAPDADRTLTSWLNAQGLSREQLYGIGSTDNGLDGELRLLQEALIGYELPWKGHKLADSLRRIREERNRTKSRSVNVGRLPPLNPVVHSRRSVR